MYVNATKHALQAGEIQLGTWIHVLGHRHMPTILASAGFDYVMIDMEHSSFSLDEVAVLSTASLQAGITPVVRPPLSTTWEYGTRALDNAAMGIYLPHVDDAARAHAAVRALRFPPEGNRGSMPPGPVNDFGTIGASDYCAHYNDELLLIAQIESARALGNLEDIMATPGLDGASVGRGDLAADLGFPGQRDHPDVEAAVVAVIDACKRHGKISALLVPDERDAERWISQGVRMVTIAGEVNLITRSGQQLTDHFRGRGGPGSA